MIWQAAKAVFRALFPGVGERIKKLETELFILDREIGKLDFDIRYGDEEAAMIERYALRKQREEIIHQLLIEKNEMEIQ